MSNGRGNKTIKIHYQPSFDGNSKKPEGVRGVVGEPFGLDKQVRGDVYEGQGVFEEDGRSGVMVFRRLKKPVVEFDETTKEFTIYMTDEEFKDLVRTLGTNRATTVLRLLYEVM